MSEQQYFIVVSDEELYPKLPLWAATEIAQKNSLSDPLTVYEIVDESGNIECVICSGMKYKPTNEVVIPKFVSHKVHWHVYKDGFHIEKGLTFDTTKILAETIMKDDKTAIVAIRPEGTSRLSYIFYDDAVYKAEKV